MNPRGSATTLAARILGLQRPARALLFFAFSAAACLALSPGVWRGLRSHPHAGALFFQRFHHPRAEPADVTITVDPASQYQVLDGFGQAEPSTLLHPGYASLSDSLRAVAVEKAYRQVGINMGIAGSLLESPGDYSQVRNDNGDPFSINWSGFNSFDVDSAKRYVIDLAKPYGFTNYYLGAEAPNVRFASPWMADLRVRNYGSYLDEVAEQVLANVTYWKNTYGEELPYYQLGNEQLSGNRAMSNPDMSGYGPVDPVQQMVDIAKRAGDRLRAAGFTKTRFLVGTEETEQVSLQLAAAILADPAAARYVGAIGYHSYPYGEGYSSVSFILTTSGSGAPDRGRIALRNQLRDLGTKNNVRIWMTENSHAGDPQSYDSFRARAIQIHDEFLYANASAYFGENALWDLATQRLHFGNSNLFSPDNEGNIVFVNNDTGAIDISGIGYAIGHYARWIRPGAVRIDASSSDPLVQVTAFRDDSRQRATVVLINNGSITKNLTVSLPGLTIGGNISGELSTPSAYWQPVTPFAPGGPSAFTVTLRPSSVMSLAFPWTGAIAAGVPVVCAASYTGGAVAPDSIAAAFLPNLPIDTAQASDLPLPFLLGGASASLVDSSGATLAAPLFFTSPGQLNFLVPAGAAAGPATMNISGPAGILASGQLTVASVAPGLFSANGDGQGVAAAQVQRVRADGSQSLDPVYQCGSAPGSCRSVPLDLGSAGTVYLVFYGTGFRNRSDLSNVTVAIGGAAGQVLYAGAHPTAPGLDQLNVVAPRLRGTGETDVVVTIDGQAANIVRIGVL